MGGLFSTHCCRIKHSLDRGLLIEVGVGGRGEDIRHILYFQACRMQSDGKEVFELSEVSLYMKYNRSDSEFIILFVRFRVTNMSSNYYMKILRETLDDSTVSQW